MATREETRVYNVIANYDDLEKLEKALRGVSVTSESVREKMRAVETAAKGLSDEQRKVATTAAQYETAVRKLATAHDNLTKATDPAEQARFATEAKKAATQVDRLEDELRQATRAAAQVESKKLRDVGTNAKAAQGGVKGLATSLGGLKTLITGIGLGVIANELAQIATEALALAEIQRQAEAAVELAVERTGQAAGRTAEQLKAQASALQGATNFGDEDILSNLTQQFLTFNQIQGEVFDRGQRLALDYATVIAGDGPVNLKGAAIQFGKVLNDPVKNLSALAKSGVAFTAEQETMIKALADSNRLFEAQTIILDEIEAQYGGAAAAAREASDGVQVLANNWGDLLEIIGQDLSPTRSAVVGLLNDFLQYEIGRRQAFNALDDAVTAGLVSTERRKEIVRELNAGTREYGEVVESVTAMIAENNAQFEEFLPNGERTADVFREMSDGAQQVQTDFSALSTEQREVAIAQLEVEIATRKLARAQAELSAETDPDKQAEMQLEVLKLTGALEGARDAFLEISPAAAEAADADASLRQIAGTAERTRPVLDAMADAQERAAEKAAEEAEALAEAAEAYREYLESIRAVSDAGANSSRAIITRAFEIKAEGDLTGFEAELQKVDGEINRTIVDLLSAREGTTVSQEIAVEAALGLITFDEAQAQLANQQIFELVDATFGAGAEFVANGTRVRVGEFLIENPEQAASLAAQMQALIDANLTSEALEAKTLVQRIAIETELDEGEYTSLLQRTYAELEQGQTVESAIAVAFNPDIENLDTLREQLDAATTDFQALQIQTRIDVAEADLARLTDLQTIAEDLAGAEDIQLSAEFDTTAVEEEVEQIGVIKEELEAETITVTAEVAGTAQDELTELQRTANALVSTYTLTFLADITQARTNIVALRREADQTAGNYELVFESDTDPAARALQAFRLAEESRSIVIPIQYQAGTVPVPAGGAAPPQLADGGVFRLTSAQPFVAGEAGPELLFAIPDNGSAASRELAQRATAAMAERGYITPQDIRSTAPTFATPPVAQTAPSFQTIDNSRIETTTQTITNDNGQVIQNFHLNRATPQEHRGARLLAEEIIQLGIGS